MIIVKDLFNLYKCTPNLNKLSIFVLYHSYIGVFKSPQVFVCL